MSSPNRARARKKRKRLKASSRRRWLNQQAAEAIARLEVLHAEPDGVLNVQGVVHPFSYVPKFQFGAFGHTMDFAKMGHKLGPILFKPV